MFVTWKTDKPRPTKSIFIIYISSLPSLVWIYTRFKQQSKLVRQQILFALDNVLHAIPSLSKTCGREFMATDA